LHETSSDPVWPYTAPPGFTSARGHPLQRGTAPCYRGPGHVIARSARGRDVMTRTLLAVVLSIGLSIVWLVPARGAPLAPSKPSQIVTLQPDVLVGTPPCTGVQLGVRQMVNPDLTTAPLTIPDKQVLVVTSGTWRTASAATPAERHLSLRLFLRDGTA